MFDKRIFELAPGMLRYILGRVACLWVALVAQALLVFEFGRLLGLVASGGASQAGLARFAAYALVCLVLVFAGQALAQNLGTKAGSLAAREARRALYEKLVRLGPSFTERLSVTEASSLLGEGVERLRPYASAYLPQLFFAVIAPVTLFALVAPRDLPVAIVLLVCVPLMPVSIMALMKAAKRAMGEYWDSYVDLSGMFAESVRALTTLKIYQADAARHEQMNEAAEGFRATTMRLLRAQLNSVTIMDFFTYAGSALGCIIVLFQFGGAVLSFGEALAVVVLALEFFLPMRRFGSLFHTGMGAGTVLGQMYEVLDTPEPQRGTKEVDAERLDLVCEDVGYVYGEAGEGGREVLHDVSLHAEPGSYTGITGESGSGKSTLGKILTGRYTGYTGSVRLGGVELRELAPEALHSLVTLVSSESHVFKGTLRSNLELGNPDATDADMWKALHECHLDTFAVSAGGLDAAVSEGGANLSGGERQRLRAARALLHDTPIYVFDEATANIDAESEKAILDFIQQISMEKTVIVISHRLSCLVWTDRIYVLDAGRLAQEGEHQMLVAQAGPYQVLWGQQQGLEEFARQTEGVVEAEIAIESHRDEAVNKLIANMPDKIASVVKASYEAKPIAEMITGHKRRSSGHPSWIPLSDEERAALEALEAEEESGETAERPSGAGALAPEEKRGRGAFAIVRGLMRVTREQWGLLGRATLLGILAALSAAGIPLLAIYGLLGSLGLVPLESPVALVAGMAACGTARGFLRYGERLCTHDQTFRTLALLRDRCFGAMRRLAPAKLEEHDSGDLLSLLTTDIELLEMFYSRTLSPVLVSLVVMVAATVAIAVLSPVMGAVAAAGFAVAGIVLPLVSTHVMQEQGRSSRERAVVMGSFMAESLHGLAEILQFGWGDAGEGELDEKMGPGSAVGSGGRSRAGTVLGALGPSLVLLFDALLVGCACALVAGGALAPERAILAVAVFLATTDAAMSVSSLGATLSQTLAAGERVLDLLEEEPQTPEVTDGVDLDGFTGMRIRDVDFSYGGEQVLNHVNIEIPEGAIVRLLGPSGTGKSTIVKLAMRFFDVGAGSVEISGHDVREVNTGSLRRLEGYMTQDSYLFAGTLRDNLAFAKPDASDAELMTALDKAALGRFVRALSDGLDTEFGTDNVGLSDGERQRLGLARMFLHDAPFFILDEPTSNLDALNEAAILRSLAENSEGKTMFIVSHRASVGIISDITYTTRRTTPELTMGRYL